MSDIQLSLRDVIRVDNSQDGTFLVEDLVNRIYNSLPSSVDEIANGGLSCEALKIGDDWIEGKLKLMIVLETKDVSSVPQNDDSPLDDIRNLA